jgi:hypothetical protein
MDAMMIATNLSPTNPVHDLLLHPPIEKQLMDMLGVHFATVTHELLVKQYIFTLEGDYQVTPEITKKTVLISTYYPKIRFGDLPHPSVRLPYNQDVDAKVAKFALKIKRVQEIEARAKALPEQPDRQAINDFLNKELSTKSVVAHYWHEEVFSGLPLHFYLHPRHEAPGDGVMVCLEGDNRIEPWWNGSSEKRKKFYGGSGQIEDAVGRRNQGTDIASMQKRIDEVKELQDRIAQFDPTKSPALMKLLELKRQAAALTEEFAKAIK